MDRQKNAPQWGDGQFVKFAVLFLLGQKTIVEKVTLEQKQKLVEDYRNEKDESGSECSTFERMTSKSCPARTPAIVSRII